MRLSFAAPRSTANDATPALLEFRSPTASMLAQPLPLSGRLTIWTIAATVVTGIAIAGIAPADRVVTVPGRLVSRVPPVVVQPLETAVLRELPVYEGQLVHAGTLLARLDPSFAAADTKADEAQVASLHAEVDRLTAESQGRTYTGDGTPAGTLQALLFAQRHAELTSHMESAHQRIEAARAKQAQAESDIAAYTEQFKVAQAKEAIRDELARMQVGSKLNALDAGAARAEAARALYAADAARRSAESELEATIAERDATLAQFQTETSQLLAEQQRKLAEARSALEKSQRRRALVELRADRDAVVLSVAKLSPGAVAQSGTELVTLVPSDAALEIDANVPGSEAGYVQTGHKVEIKFDTFPYAEHGDAEGRVVSVSADSFAANDRNRSVGREAGGPAGEADREVVYQARISLDRSRLHDLPPGFRLTPGMPVTADVEAGKRTLLQYLLARAMPVLSEGMREP